MSILLTSKLQPLAHSHRTSSVPTQSVVARQQACSHHTSIRHVAAAQQRLVTARVAGGTETARVQQDVSVEEVMNPRPVLLQDSMSIKDAVHTMLDANVAGAPVVNATGQIVGVLTEADVIWKGAGKPEEHFIIPPVYIGALDAYLFLRDNKAFEEETHKILARTVGDAMVSAKDKKLVTVKPNTPMSDAAQLMLHHDVNLLPVVDDDNTVVGVVTRHDILRGIYASKSPLL